MAWGVFTFSKEGRARLAGVLRALLIAQLIVSLCMVIFCYNTSLRVMLLLKQIHKVTVYLLYGLILLQAYSLKLHYTSGLRLITILLRWPYWSRATSLTKIWMVTGTLIAANGLLVYAACRSTLKALMRELSSSLRIGISQYLTDPSWKRLIDTMQVELSCCGADKPSDWHEIPWINVDFLNEDSDVVMNLAGADGKILPPVSPYSCCTPRVLAPCYHDPMQQWQWRGSWASSAGWSLHARGCVEAVRAPLTAALLALQCFNLLVLFFQLVILVLTQLLRTSARDAVLRGVGGEDGGPGRGYVLGTLPPTDKLARARPWSSGGGAEVPPRDVTRACAVSLRRKQRRARTRRNMRTRRNLRTRTTYPYLS